jgi:head-tail adaptor
MSRELIDQRMLNSLGDFYSSRVRIQAPVNQQDSFGEVITSSWEDVLIDIPANIAPFLMRNVGEIRFPQGVLSVEQWIITIAGYYRQITEEMRVVSPEKIYQITNIEFDSQNKQIRLKCEIVRPS